MAKKQWDAVIDGGAAGSRVGTVLARAQDQVEVADAGRPRNAPVGQRYGVTSPAAHEIGCGDGGAI